MGACIQCNKRTYLDTAPYFRFCSDRCALDHLHNVIDEERGLLRTTTIRTMVGEFKSRLDTLVDQAYHYGDHKKDCPVAIEIAGPTPVKSDCTCGWHKWGKRLLDELRDLRTLR